MKKQAHNRHGYLDLLRIVAAFLVIVNHTNSGLFRASNPSQGIWFASLAWYYLSKMAVPLFVMVSGACLLAKVDSYAKNARRILRMVLVTIVFSYAYYLMDAWVYYGLWPRMVEWKAFFALIWPLPIVDSFWYLYFYVGLLLLLPLIQRFVKQATKKDLGYGIALSFGMGALLPLIAHYMPAVMPSDALMLTVPSSYIGLLLSGHYLHQYGQNNRPVVWGGLMIVSVALSVWLTYGEYAQNPQRYWFMDDRFMPSILTILAAIGAFLLAKGVSKGVGKGVSRLGRLSFAVYLMQELVIAQTEMRLYVPITQWLPAGVSMLLWEGIVFGISLLLAWMLTKLPWVKKLL